MEYVEETRRGGSPGYVPTKAEMARASERMFPGEGFIDLAIPIGTGKRCADTESHSQMRHAVYWEREDGSHGWACAVCGEVLQWG